MTLVIVESKDWRGCGVRVPVFVRPEDLEEFQLFCARGGQHIVAMKEGFTVEVEEKEEVHAV
jgi:predicted hydrocarbon binding protein